MSDNDNLILFPKWKDRLEEQSLQALKEKKYEQALEKLEKLISFHINNHEIMMGKLICLIELGRHIEAEDLCEDLLFNPDEYYYQYLHIYLTVLFQTNQYKLLMNLVEKELGKENIPEPIKNQIVQLYELSSKMQEDIVEEEIVVFENDFEEAIREHDYQRQWQIIEKMRHIKIQPKAKLIQYLQNQEVHPVVKTSILYWLRDSGNDQTIMLVKFNQKCEIQCNDIFLINDHLIYKKTLLIIKDIEQENPTFYNFLKQLLYQYLYVRFPFLPKEEDVAFIAESLKEVGKDYFGMDFGRNGIEDSTLLSYIEEIRLCQSLYLSIIEE